MSEYQYYEFQAIDRRLGKEEMAELRAISARASITPTSFINVYNYGNFKGNPLEMMKRYFDAHIYVTNWGTHQLMLRLPFALLPAEIAMPYAVPYVLEVHSHDSQTILDFTSQEEEPQWEEEDDERLQDLLPVRADLADGDLRPLYLGWLSGVAMGELEDEVTEPPVPAGLGQLSPALQSLAEFLRIDEDLLAVAVAKSRAKRETPFSPAHLEAWIRALPTTEKDALLLRLVADSQALLREELLQQFRQSTMPQPLAARSARTVGELRAEAEERAEVRRREEARRKEAERERRRQEQAAARAAYLDKLALRQEGAWREAESMVESRRPTEYDQAVRVLRDLRDLAVRDGNIGSFEAHLHQLCDRHAKKVSFLERLRSAGLTYR